MFPDEAQRLAGKKFLGEAFFLDQGVAAKQRRDAVSFVGPVVGACVGETIEKIEAALQRQETFGASAVPLSHRAGGVARAFYELAERDLPHVEAQCHLRRVRIFLRRVAVTIAHHFIPDHFVETVALGIAAGENAAAGGSARGRGRIERRRLHPLGRHAVEIRGDDFLAAEAPQIAIALIIADDDDDVGLSRGARRRRSDGGEKPEARRDDGEAKNDFFHGVKDFSDAAIGGAGVTE